MRERYLYDTFDVVNKTLHKVTTNATLQRQNNCFQDLLPVAVKNGHDTTVSHLKAVSESHTQPTAVIICDEDYVFQYLLR